MHATEDDKDNADFSGEILYCADDVFGMSTILEEHHNEAEVHEVKSDAEQVVDCPSHLGVSVESIDEEDPAGFVEGLRDPDRHGDGRGNVERVGDEN